MQPAQNIINDVRGASPVTLVFLACVGGCCAYVLLSMVLRVFKLAKHGVNGLCTAVASLFPHANSQKRVKKQVVAPGPAPVHSSSRSDKAAPGKGMRALLKEAKRADATVHEAPHESEFFVASLKGHGGVVLSVAISADDQHVVTACDDQVLRIFEFGDFSARPLSVCKQTMRQTPVGALFWGDAATTAAIVTGVGSDFVVTKTTRSGSKSSDSVVCEQKSVHGALESVLITGASSSGGRRPVLASLTKKKELKVFTGAGQVLATLEPAGIENYDVAVSRDGRFIAAATWGSDVKLWELSFARDGAFKGCEKAMELKGHRQGVLSVAFSPDVSRAVTASRDGTLRVWNIDVRYHMREDPKVVLEVPLGTKDKIPYARLCWCPNGVIVGVTGHAMHYLSSATGQILASVEEAHSKRITCVECTSKPVQCGSAAAECLVLSSGIDGKVRAWMVPRRLLD